MHGYSSTLLNSSTISSLQMGVSPIAVVLRWTLQRGVVVVPRTATPAHIQENIAVGGEDNERYRLSEEDMVALDAMNEAHPYYWSPLPVLPPGTKVDK